MNTPKSPPLSQSLPLAEEAVVQSENFEFLGVTRADLAALSGFAEPYAFNDSGDADQLLAFGCLPSEWSIRHLTPLGLAMPHHLNMLVQLTN